MICAGCAHENRPGAKFCEECAAPLKRVCASCGSELRSTAKFCDECGAPASGAAPAPRPAEPGGARKIVTIVFADLVGSRKIRRGELVLPSIAAAHRDPARFPDPDRVDITRDLSDAALFGRGPHSCLGAQLARLELAIAYGKLVDELPGLRLACAYDEVPFSAHPIIRSIASLPLRFGAGFAERI